MDRPRKLKQRCSFKMNISWLEEWSVNTSLELLWLGRSLVDLVSHIAKAFYSYIGMDSLDNLHVTVYLSQLEVLSDYLIMP